MMNHKNIYLTNNKFNYPETIKIYIYKIIS